MDDLTDRQRREIDTTIRHVGRAMRSFARVRVPDLPKSGNARNWWWSLREAEEAIVAASNKLIDATEGVHRYYDPGMNEEVVEYDDPTDRPEKGI